MFDLFPGRTVCVSGFVDGRGHLRRTVHPFRQRPGYWEHVLATSSGGIIMSRAVTMTIR